MVSSSLKLFAPAKVNLRLEVLGELPNHYHLVRMFNIMVSLFDEIELQFEKSGIVIEADNPLVPKGKDNLIYRVVDYFQKRFGYDFGVKIWVKKKIPLGAGLGGGSSDCGVVLKVLCERFGVSVDELNLEEVAYGLGADVPYLIFGGPSWVEGIGELIEPVKGVPKVWYLLVKPEFSISTKWVYQEYHLDRDLTIEPKEVIIKKILNGAWKEFCINQLEKVVFREYEELKELKLELSRLGSEAVVMSGSGSTLVGIFLERAQAELAKKELLRKNLRIWSEVVQEYQP